MTERVKSKTLRLYESDSTVSDFDATVLLCEKHNDKYKVILDRTAFFPEGGGQSCDTGRIGDASVSDVYLEGENVIHVTDVPVQVGAILPCSLDFEKRLEKMRSHSAEHILSSVIDKGWGFKNVGFHLGSLDTTCDFDGVLSSNDIRICEDEVNRIIRENHVIYPTFPSEDELKDLEYRSKLDLSENVRIVNIGENGSIDKCACCAPHVTHTGMIGLFKITDFYKYKGGTRVHILTGKAALDKVITDGAGIRTLSAMLSAKPDPTDVISAVTRLENEIKALKNELSELNLKLNEEICSHLKEGERAVLFDSRNDTEALRRLALAACERVGTTAAVFGGEDGNYRFVICGNESRAVFDSLKEALNVKGGGKDVICGTVNEDKETILKKI